MTNIWKGYKTSTKQPGEAMYSNGGRYILRCAQQDDAWTLESGFDGAALLPRASITLVTACNVFLACRMPAS